MTPIDALPSKGEINDHHFNDDDSCWQCGGEGYMADCIDGCCQDAEMGCDLCTRRCDICRGTGYLPPPETSNGT